MRLYEKLYATPAERDDAGTTGDGEAIRRRRFSWKNLILPAGLLVLLVVTSSLLDRSTAPPPQRPPAPVANVVTAPVLQTLSSVRTSPAAEKETTPAIPAAVSQKSIDPLQRPAMTQQQNQAAKGFIVRMRVIHSGSLAVTIDGATAQNYELSGGDVIEWKADKTVTLELSNAGGVEIELNGKQIKPVGPEGKPAYVTLDAEGVRS